MDQETLLIVDDNKILLEGIRDLLTSEGFIVNTALNGQEALEKMEPTIPDLIISDISMPVMDGYTFFQKVRSKPEWVTIPFVILTAHGEKSEVIAGKNLGVEDYLIKPVSRDELLTAIRARLDRNRQLRIVQLQQAYTASLTVLASAIDLRDTYTRGHVERVTAYSQILAVELGWSGHALEQLKFGAILHDIGKIFIRESTLLKPGPLTDGEWEEIKKHPITGAEMIKEIPYLSGAIPVIRHHHEQWDGSGYPDQLSAEQIPMSARIVAVADGFDAMTTNRPYCRARSSQDAYKEILRNSNSQFDPAIIETFKKVWDKKKFKSITDTWTIQNSLTP